MFISRTEACISDIREWMQESYLKLNDSKTEFLLLGSRQQLAKFKAPALQIGTSFINPVEKARDLGVIFDCNMTMEHHISNCVRQAYHSLRNLRCIRKYLSQKAAEQLVHAFVTSRIDCCNALLYGLPKTQLQKLQRVQNAAARLVTNTRKSAHISPILRRLHWLPVKQRVEYKILLMTFRTLKFMSPLYMNELIKIYKPSRSGLRSSASSTLVIPKSKRSWGDRAFSSASPRLWNTLPTALQQSGTVDNFKSKLKAHLMKGVF